MYLTFQAKAVAIIKSQGGAKAQEKNIVKNKRKISDPEYLEKINKKLSSSSDSGKYFIT